MRSAFERCRLGDHMVSLDGFCWRCGYDLLGNGRTVVASNTRPMYAHYVARCDTGKGNHDRR